MAELADARDSKSRALHWACGFDPHLQHQFSIVFKVQPLVSQVSLLRRLFGAFIVIDVDEHYGRK